LAFSPGWLSGHVTQSCTNRFVHGVTCAVITNRVKGCSLTGRRSPLCRSTKHKPSTPSPTEKRWSREEATCSRDGKCMGGRTHLHGEHPEVVRREHRIVIAQRLKTASRPLRGAGQVVSAHPRAADRYTCTTEQWAAAKWVRAEPTIKCTIMHGQALRLQTPSREARRADGSPSEWARHPRTPTEASPSRTPPTSRWGPGETLAPATSRQWLSAGLSPGTVGVLPS